MWEWLQHGYGFWVRSLTHENFSEALLGFGGRKLVSAIWKWGFVFMEETKKKINIGMQIPGEKKNIFPRKEKNFSIRCIPVLRACLLKLENPPIVEDRWVDERSHDGVSSQRWLVDVLRGISLGKKKKRFRTRFTRLCLHTKQKKATYQEFPRDCLLRKFCPHVQRPVHETISRQRVFVEKASESSQQCCHLFLDERPTLAHSEEGNFNLMPMKSWNSVKN